MIIFPFHHLYFLKLCPNLQPSGQHLAIWALFSIVYSFHHLCFVFIHFCLVFQSPQLFWCLLNSILLSSLPGLLPWTSLLCLLWGLSPSVCPLVLVVLRAHSLALFSPSTFFLDDLIYMHVFWYHVFINIFFKKLSLPLTSLPKLYTLTFLFVM